MLKNHNHLSPHGVFKLHVSCNRARILNNESWETTYKTSWSGGGQKNPVEKKKPWGKMTGNLGRNQAQALQPILRDKKNLVGGVSLE